MGESPGIPDRGVFEFETLSYPHKYDISWRVNSPVVHDSIKETLITQADNPIVQRDVAYTRGLTKCDAAALGDKE